MLNDSAVHERLAFLDNAISNIYQWWAKEKPGVTPVEIGDLGRYWDEFDRLVPLVGTE